MGIKNVNEIVREKCPKAFLNIRLNSLKNKRVAIDSAIWFHANMAVAQRETVRKMKDLFEEIDRGDLMQYCISSAVKFYMLLLDNGISSFWIKDGKTPKEKKDTRAKRKEVRDNRKMNIEELRQKLVDQDILLRNPKEIEELRKMMMFDITIFPAEYETFFNTLEGFGIPIVTAPGEAEAYACSLNREGIIYGIWTTDTDCYALGGVNMITGMEGRDEEGFDIISVVHIPYIRKYLEFDEDEMRDFCIMCGTDFNMNIPNVGTLRAYQAIEKYRSIEGYANENSKKDIKILNHEKSRELLTPPQCDVEINSPILNFNMAKFRDTAKDLSVQYGLTGFYGRLEKYLLLNIEVEIYDISKGPKMKKNKIRLVIDGVEQETVSKKEQKTVDKQYNSLAEMLAAMKVGKLE